MKYETMYKEELMDIYCEKPNYGRLDEKTNTIKLKNPGCEDEITIDLQIKKGKIIDAKYSGHTCIISTISASLILESIKGKKINEVLSLNKKDVDKFLGIEIIPTRIKCALFPLEAVKKCLK